MRVGVRGALEARVVGRLQRWSAVMPTDYSAYYSESASAVLNASVAAESRTSIDGALGYPAPECPYHAEAEAFVGKLAIGKYRTAEQDKCYCDKCYSGPDVLEDPPGLVAPRGWVKFALNVPPPTQTDTSDWSPSFYGVASEPVLRRALRNGHLLSPSEALQDGSLLDNDELESVDDLWPEDTSDISVRLRAFYRLHSPEHEDKAEQLAQRFAAAPSKLNKELRKRYDGADLSDPLFLHESRGRAMDAFWTSPTIRYAGLKYYARPQEYVSSGAFAGGSSMAASMAFECRQRPGSFGKGPETMGFRRLAMQRFPGWDSAMDQEWVHVKHDEVEWTARDYNPKDVQLVSLMVRVFATNDVSGSTEHEEYCSPLDTEHRPLLAQWNNFMSTHHNTAKAPFKADKAAKRCEGCSRPFGRTMDAREGPQFRRRHHCRACGGERALHPPCAFCSLALSCGYVVGY